MRENMSGATSLLGAVEEGNKPAVESLLALVYDELRRLATYKLAQEAPGQTLQPTALVHEAWLRLMGGASPRFANRAHFFSVAAEAMRRILIDRARRKLTQRHGGGFDRVSLDGIDVASPDNEEQLLAVSDALDRLAIEYPAQAAVVKLRYFVGLTNEEVAELQGISVSTVKNYWVFARAWLFHAIRAGQ